MSSDFSFASGNLGESTTRSRTLRIVRNMIASRSPRRWRRMQRDYAWLKEQAISVHMNPEDARFLL